jgi:hypothetical protein
MKTKSNIFAFLLYIVFVYVFVVEQRSSSLTVCERFCAAFIPFLSIIEVLILAMADCFKCRRPHPMKRGYASEDHARLANETICNFSLPFSIVCFMIYISILNKLTWEESAAGILSRKNSQTRSNVKHEVSCRFLTDRSHA